MKTAKPIGSKVISDYRRRAAARRLASDLANTALPDVAGVTSEGGIVTVRIGRDAKPVSELGGPSKVFGPSKIWIPEFRRSRKPQ